MDYNTNVIISEIKENISNCKFSNELHIAINSSLESSNFHTELNSTLQNNFTCTSSLKLSEIIFLDVWDFKPDNNFLNLLYINLLEINFPNDKTISLNIDDKYLIYLCILRVISTLQKKSNDNTFESLYPLNFLSKNEIFELEDSSEYKTFIDAFNNKYVYEMMKINQELYFYNTLDHICGVHYLSLYIARQLKNCNIIVDLGKVSGASAGHDIGKYGCKNLDSHNVAYLHYFYTDMWFKNNNINYIRNIAVNHSTWDLELENLSIESLILIYCDFRVKNIPSSNNKMSINSLKDSFNIIKSKLDNVDENKSIRYKKVYKKLEDFENYMLSLGISLIPKEKSTNIKSEVKFALLNEREISNNYKYSSIYHNINLMYYLRSESSLNYILDIARSENDSDNLREYLFVIEEYSTYFTQKQKIISINFLQDLLTHSEEDIRKQSSEIIGLLIVNYDEDYRKTLPDDVKLNESEEKSVNLFNRCLKYILVPDYKLMPNQKENLGHSFSSLIKSIFSNSSLIHIKDYTNVLLNYYNIKFDFEENCPYLIEGIKHIPYTDDIKTASILINYLIYGLNFKNENIELLSLKTLVEINVKFNNNNLFEKSKEILSKYKTNSTNFCSNFLLNKFFSKNNIQEKPDFNSKSLADIFLSDLKTATYSVVKEVQIDILLNVALININAYGLYTAMHLCNLLKVSNFENVRSKAGEAIIKLLPLLTCEQRNDICIELLRALEIEGYHYTKYIPNYLGKMLLFLKPVELDEVIDDLYLKVKQSGYRLNSLFLNTLGVCISNYESYKLIYEEDEKVYNSRLDRMLGILISALSNFDSKIKRISLRVICQCIFINSNINSSYKAKIFIKISKKLLTLIDINLENTLDFFNDSAVLNHIYRFISYCELNNIDIYPKVPEKIAFFPGTFDPFSLSHKEIVKNIRDLGFEVYLSIDEFSWSKQTLPNKQRYNIVNQSIANEFGVYIFPESIPINLGNENDLCMLHSIFKCSEIYIVIGSDVLLNASSYFNDKNMIFNFSHIIFKRVSNTVKFNNDNFIEISSKIKKDLIVLNLEPQFEDISSTQIRNNIDNNRDISNLIDPLAQKYIYINSLYRREPQYKSVIQAPSININIYENISDNLLDEIFILYNNDSKIINRMINFSKNHHTRICVIRDIKTNQISAFSIFHWVRLASLFDEIKDVNITEFIRKYAKGRIVFIDDIFCNEESLLSNIYELIITETLSFCISKDYGTAVYNCLFGLDSDLKITQVLSNYGFIKLPNTDKNILIVNMTSPTALILDFESTIKEPFKSNSNVCSQIYKTRTKLQQSLVNLYSGNLILPFSRDVLYEKLINKVCAANNVPDTSSNLLGKKMCVPFGNILKRNVVPNTITKSLHTEKFYSSDMKSYHIGSLPNYLSLENQVRTLKSFNKPIILVDDILHRGDRIKTLYPIFNNENINIDKIIVGLLSGVGKETMDIQHKKIDCAYFIPNLQSWYYENLLYPFIGGDIIIRQDKNYTPLIPSINFILPYTMPLNNSSTSLKYLYCFSKTCLNNALDIFLSLEDEYLKIYERNLSLSNLSEVLISPRYPDKGLHTKYNLDIKASEYLKNDIEFLERTEKLYI